MERTYSELITLSDFNSRFEYLKLDGTVGEATFGFERYLNQTFYNSPEWKSFRRQVILRDNGCDLGVPGFEINDTIYVHHLNPITAEDIEERSALLLDLENAISVSFTTHQAIHFGNKDLLLINSFANRSANDTIPWRK